MHDIVSYLETNVGKSFRYLLFDKAWNHACDVHGDYLVELEAAIVGFGLHVSQNIVCHDIFTNISAYLLRDIFISLT